MMSRGLTLAVLSAALVLSLVSYASAAQAFGHCLDVPLANPFDAKEYANGQAWYEIARTPFFFEDNLVCVNAHYTLNADGTVTVLNKGNDKTPAGVLKSIQGSATIPDPTKPASLMVKFPGAPVSAPYKIVMDSGSIALIYSCTAIGIEKFEYGWILSRTPTISDADYTATINAAAKVGIDVARFSKTLQGGDCKYE
jgi:apolipoprotein D and lipocalin family protein